jgi:hypothetical protein
VDNLFATTGIDLTNGGGIPELIKFQEHFKVYRIVAFRGSNCKDLVFDGQIESEKRINLLYDGVTFAKGYKIPEIQQVYQYEVTQYNPETGDGGIL